MPDMKQEKPGYKTTEFWLSFAAMLVGAILSSGAITSEGALQVLGVAATMLSALGYTVVRGNIKANTIKSAALVEASKLGKSQD